VRTYVSADMFLRFVTFMVWVRRIRDYLSRIRILLFLSTVMLSITVITRPYVRKFLPLVTSSLIGFDENILLEAWRIKKLYM
jgi:hypothetical protein